MLRTEHRDWITARLTTLGYVGIEAEVLDMVASFEEREADLVGQLAAANERISELEYDLQEAEEALADCEG